MKYAIYIFLFIFVSTACGSNNIAGKKYLGVYFEGSIVYERSGGDPYYGCYKVDLQKDSIILSKLTIYFTFPMKIDTTYISTTAYKKRFNTIITGNSLIPKLKTKGDKLIAPEVYCDDQQALFTKDLVFENLINHQHIFPE